MDREEILKQKIRARINGSDDELKKRRQKKVLDKGLNKLLRI